MEQKFASREYVIPGEIQHVLGLRLWLSEVGVITTSPATVVDEGKRYLDDLDAAGRLEPAGEDDDSEMRASGYGGLGIHENGTVEYRELYVYLKQLRAAAALRQHPIRAKELLKEMESDPSLFFRRLNLSNSEDTLFYDVPILAALLPDQFVSSFLGHHPVGQRTILIALKTRYENGRLDRDLPTERPWLEAVCAKLIAASESMPVMARYRLKNSVGYNLTSSLEVS
jgi:hypothetical protein